MSQIYHRFGGTKYIQSIFRGPKFSLNFGAKGEELAMNHSHEHITGNLSSKTTWPTRILWCLWIKFTWISWTRSRWLLIFSYHAKCMLSPCGGFGVLSTLSDPKKTGFVKFFVAGWWGVGDANQESNGTLDYLAMQKIPDSWLAIAKIIFGFKPVQGNERQIGTAISSDKHG